MSDDRDSLLLRRYAEDRDEAAFAKLVERHVDAVYSFALRRMNGDEHLAQDITQQVFVALARDAARVARRPALIGWLYSTTRHQAANAIRTERRRSNANRRPTPCSKHFCKDQKRPIGNLSPPSSKPRSMN